MSSQQENKQNKKKWLVVDRFGTWRAWEMFSIEERELPREITCFYEKIFWLKAKKGDLLVTITTILFFFSSQVIHQIPVNWTFNMIDCQYDYRAFPADATCWLWIPTKNWFLINITTNAQITWIFWVKIETYLGRVESMLDVATLMLLGRVASHSDNFLLIYSKIKMWNIGLVWDHDQSIWKPHWRNQGEKWQAPSSSDLD